MHGESFVTSHLGWRERGRGGVGKEETPAFSVCMLHALNSHWRKMSWLSLFENILFKLLNEGVFTQKLNVRLMSIPNTKNISLKKNKPHLQNASISETRMGTKKKIRTNKLSSLLGWVFSHRTNPTLRGVTQTFRTSACTWMFSAQRHTHTATIGY